MVKSKYSFYTYFGVFSGVALIIILIILLATVDTWGYTQKALISKAFGSIVIITLILFMLFRVFKTSPQIIVSENLLKIPGIFHKRKELTITDILEIDLLAIGMYNQSATIITKIKLVNGETIKLIAPNYKNISEIKLALIDYFPEKIKKTNPITKEVAKIPSYNFEPIEFSGNPFTSFNSLLIYAFIIGIIITTKEFGLPHLLLIIPIAGIFWGLSYQLHYFIFLKEKLIVRNHFLPWIHKQYDIKNIIALNFESARNTSYSLRITTNDYKSSIFPAGSLRDKNWDDLKAYIKKQGIYFID